MSNYHAAVWLDHADAHILHFRTEDVQNKLAHWKPHQRLHHKRGAPDPERLAEDQAYYGKIAASLTDAKEILVTGPADASAKAAFVEHLNEHAHEVRAKVIAIETVDHPSDGQLLDYARKHFGASERPHAT